MAVVRQQAFLYKRPLCGLPTRPRHPDALAPGVFCFLRAGATRRKPRGLSGAAGMAAQGPHLVHGEKKRIINSPTLSTEGMIFCKSKIRSNAAKGPIVSSSLRRLSLVSLSHFKPNRGYLCRMSSLFESRSTVSLLALRWEGVCLED